MSVRTDRHAGIQHSLAGELMRAAANTWSKESRRLLRSDILATSRAYWSTKSITFPLNQSFSTRYVMVMLNRTLLCASIYVMLLDVQLHPCFPYKQKAHALVCNYAGFDPHVPVLTEERCLAVTGRVPGYARRIRLREIRGWCAVSPCSSLWLKLLAWLGLPGRCSGSRGVARAPGALLGLPGRECPWYICWARTSTCSVSICESQCNGSMRCTWMLECSCHQIMMIFTRAWMPYTYIRTNTHTYTHIYTYMHTYIFTHTHTHTGPQIRWKVGGKRDRDPFRCGERAANPRCQVRTSALHASCIMFFKTSFPLQQIIQVTHVREQSKSLCEESTHVFSKGMDTRRCLRRSLTSQASLDKCIYPSTHTLLRPFWMSHSHFHILCST